MTDEQLGELKSAAALLRGVKARIEAVGEPSTSSGRFR
jgi:hypothetical protein